MTFNEHMAKHVKEEKQNIQPPTPILRPIPSPILPPPLSMSLPPSSQTPPPTLPQTPPPTSPQPGSRRRAQSVSYQVPQPLLSAVCPNDGKCVARGDMSAKDRCWLDYMYKPHSGKNIIICPFIHRKDQCSKWKLLFYSIIRRTKQCLYSDCRYTHLDWMDDTAIIDALNAGLIKHSDVFHFLCYHMA